MIVLIDTNVIIDVLCKRPQFYEDSYKVIKTCLIKGFDCCISTNSATDVFYSVSKQLGYGKTKEVLKQLLSILDMVSCEPSDVQFALDAAFSDFEDCVLLAIAKRIKSRHIVTRDKTLLAKFPNETISPKAFCKSVGDAWQTP